MYKIPIYDKYALPDDLKIDLIVTEKKVIK